MTSLMARLTPHGNPDGRSPHRRVQVFAGPDPAHRALCGELTMRPAEADALIAVLAATEGPILVEDTPAIVINAGAGPVADAAESDAVRNMQVFVADVQALRGLLFLADRIPDRDDHDGRYAFRLFLPGSAETHIVAMPGRPVDEVRWMGPDTGNIWEFPRVFVDGASWVWKYAIRAVVE